MTGINFTFDLGSVSGASPAGPSQGKAADAKEAASAAQFQSVQQSLPSHSGGTLPAMNSPACDGGGCFIVHRDGPGVTTLSIGEEDGRAGDYIALPIVDGVEFLEPPVQTFASAGDYDITTLAIGEEDGGMATASPQIGSSDSAIASSGSGVLDYVEQTTLQPIAPYEPAFSDGFETAGVSDTYGVMQPVYSPGDSQAAAPTQTATYAPYEPQVETVATRPITTPQVETMATAPAAAPQAETVATIPIAKPQTEAVATLPIAKPALEPVATIPIAKPETVASQADIQSPRAKPEGVASVESPLPEFKPATTPGADAASTAPMTTAAEPAKPEGTFVSVGDYDSYIASTEGTQGGTTTVAAPAPDSPVIVPASVSETITTGEIPLEATTQPIGSPAPSTVETTIDTGAIATDPIAEPATAAIPGPASPPQPVYTLSSPAVEAAPTAGAADGSSLAAPVPLEKPPGAADAAPRLSEDDLRITTLALGEEEAGGG